MPISTFPIELRTCCFRTTASLHRQASQCTCNVIRLRSRRSFGRFVRCCSGIVGSSSPRCRRISRDSISILDSISSSLNLGRCWACSVRVKECIRSSRLMTPVLISSRHVPTFPLIAFRLLRSRLPNLNFVDDKPLCAVARFPRLLVNVSIRKFSANFLFRIDDFSGYSDWFQSNNLLCYLAMLLLSMIIEEEPVTAPKC